jgi:hypothetical protein
MKLNPTLMIAALVLIGGVGFMAGRVSSPSASEVRAELPDAPRTTRASGVQAGGGGPASGGSARSASRDRSVPTTAEGRKSRLEAIIQGENPLDRNRALLAFINQLAPEEFEDAVAHFRSLGMTESRMGEYALLLTAWGQADPTSALAYAEANTRSGFAQDTILTSWGSSDPEAAVRWALANHEGDAANPYLPGIIRGLVESDPARATELLTSLPRSEERAKGLDFILPHLLRQGNDATREWIAAISDDALKNGAMLRAATQLAVTDPAGTASWLLANPSEATDRRMDDVYSVWARSDQAAALGSLGTLPAGEVRSDALRGVISSVAAEDPKAAVSLMDRYAGDVDDRVVQNFIWHSFGADPATAAGQISRIGDEGQRDRMYRRMLGAWKERDPTSAQAWMNRNPLPEAVRNALTP